ncbi:MAG: hypothetical protein ACTHOJ_17280 [Sphingomonas oligoaromativorans]
MTETSTSDAPTPSQIAHAIAVANGHPNPDSFVARFNAALTGTDLPDHAAPQQPEAEEQAATEAEAPAAPAPEGEPAPQQSEA